MSMRALQSSPGLIAPVTALLCSLAGAGSAHAGILFSDGFAYANGDLAGNAGGTGWAVGSQWTGGAGATGNRMSGGSLVISSRAQETTRRLSATYAAGGATTYYVSLVFNAARYQGGSGQYAGVALRLAADHSNNVLIGMPGSSGGLGFDWTNTNDPSVAASNGTNYLVLLEILAGTPSGSSPTLSMRMYATTNLSMSGAALAATTPIAFSLDEVKTLSFDEVVISGYYDPELAPGVPTPITAAGLAMADNPTDAVAFTQSVVPGPAPLALGVIAGAFGGCGGPARRRRRDG
jgi:hypothetical protein